MRYSGGKGKSYPHLLNLMPPHKTYIESHLGGGAVMRHKRPAQRQIGIEIDPSVVAKWMEIADLPCEVICADAVQYLSEAAVDENTLIYADPPYVGSTRRRSRVYRFDYTDADHERLIECLRAKPCMVMLSGYDSELYQRQLIGWTRVSFRAKTHTSIRDESVWLNYEPPNRLHDSTRLGNSFREREVIKKRRTRLQSRIGGLPVIEQHSLLTWLQCHLEETP
jgi:DNA adenine methylase